MSGESTIKAQVLRLIVQAMENPLSRFRPEVVERLARMIEWADFVACYVLWGGRPVVQETAEPLVVVPSRIVIAAR